jgi:uncharacterized protein
MTPEERRLVTELFDRLGTLEDAQRDPQAERLIRDGLRQAPNALYALVQTVLVQDEALKRADARIRELEGGAQEDREQDASFLGTMRDTLFGGQKRGSVPSVRPGTGEQRMSGAWQVGAQGPQPAAAPNAMGPAGAAGIGGSFLGTAAAAAAGVVGGSLLLGGIRSMMGHPADAHAAFDPTAGAGSPWSGGAGNSDLARQAGLDDIGRGSGSEPGTRGHGFLGDDTETVADDDEDFADMGDVDPGGDDVTDV